MNDVPLFIETAVIKRNLLGSVECVIPIILSAADVLEILPCSGGRSYSVTLRNGDKYEIVLTIGLAALLGVTDEANPNP